MAAPVWTSVSVAVLGVIALGVYDVLTNFENNACEMTYMFDYPEYQKIDHGKIQKDFPSYSLFIYGEGSYLNRIKNLKLTGIPVLFIPGNAGSYKQVRSLGSVALKLSEHKNVRNHFNYFVVDFNEELSGLYGGVLTRQTDFVIQCMKKIMSLYDKSESQPKSVVLVGHSMGGMIARALFTCPDFDHSLVNTIITQATPHKKPVAALDVALHNFYSLVNEYWITHSNTTLRHVTVVSTGGGNRDVQVRYALTTLDGIVSPDRAISASTTSVPRAWVSTDHLCAVWCRQMVLLTKRALFDIVDTSTGQISLDANLRMKVFRHHFLSNNGLTGYLSREEKKIITLDPEVEWEYQVKRLWKFASRKMVKATYFAIPLLSEEGKPNDAIIIMSNLTNPDWVCYCDIPDGKMKCRTCTSLSSRAQLLPPMYSNSKYVQLTHQDIAATNDTYIIIMVPAGEKMVSIITDQYNTNLRHLVYHMPNTYDSIISFPIAATDGAAMLKISNLSTFYSLHLAGLSLPTNAYTAIITPQACRKHSAEINEGSVLRLHIPWSHEDTYTYSNYGKEASIPIKLQVGRPADYDWRLDASEPHLEMFLHPYCHYNLKLLVATQDSLGQRCLFGVEFCVAAVFCKMSQLLFVDWVILSANAVRFYALQFPGFYVVVLLMTLRGIIIAQGKGQGSTSRQSPADLLLDHGKPYYFIPIVLAVRFIIRLGFVAKLLAKLGIPKDDSTSLTEEGIYFTFLPLLMYLCAWFISYLQALLAYTLLSVISYLGRLFVWIPENVFGKLSHLQFVVSGLAVLLTFVCGTLGTLCMSSVLIWKVLRMMYMIGRKLDTKDTHRKLALIFPIMLLVNCQVLLTLGPFVIWLKTVVHKGTWFEQLSPDPSRLPALVTCTCISVLLSGDQIIPSKIQEITSGWLVYILALVVALYSMESLYRLPIFISIAALIITVPTVIGFVSSLLKTERRKDE